MSTPRFLLVLPTLLAALACGGGGQSFADQAKERAKEKIAEEAMEKLVESQVPGLDLDANGSGELSIKTGEGATLQIGGAVAVPPNFPKDVPLYPGSKLVIATAIPAAAGSPPAFQLVSESPDAPQKILDYYKANAPAGMKVVTEMATPDGHLLALATPDQKRSVNVVVSSASSGVTAVALAVTEAP